MTSNILYTPLVPIVETAFWHNLAKQKIDHLKLDNKTLKINLDPAAKNSSNTNNVHVNYDSFESNPSGPYGFLKNENTIEAFKKSSKQALLDEFGQEIFAEGNFEDIRCHPNRLYGCLLYTFVDLKKWLFNYWFAFISVPKKYFDHSMVKFAGQIPVIGERNYRSFAKQNPASANFFTAENGWLSPLPSSKGSHHRKK